ncbi:MAG: intracellular sulfur oxidation DsrE/DsrF family protein [Janthinobacterium sp.]|jgi:intracellular sulfur oxidation DsrE/DsrF family protein
MSKLLELRRTMVFRSLALAGVSALAVSHVAAAPVAPKEGHHRVVFQISDADAKKWQLLLNNVNNAQQELGEKNVTIEVVAFGPGIHMLTAESEVANRVQEAMAQGVRVVACENTMRALHLKPGDMVSGIGFVPSGVAELIRRQSAGYAYMRP